MASRVQKRRGSKADHNAFTTGAAGEITVEMPANRNFTATDGTREYGAIHLHYGDGQIGDRIPVGEELNNQVRTVVDEQKFLARITDKTGPKVSSLYILILFFTWSNKHPPI